MSDNTVSICMSVEEFQNIIAETVTKCLNSHKEELPFVQFTDPEVLNVDQVTVLLNYSKSYLSKLTSSRAIPYYKKGGKTMHFLRSQIIEWIKTGRIKTNEEIDIEATTYVTLNKRKR